MNYQTYKDAVVGIPHKIFDTQHVGDTESIFFHAPLGTVSKTNVSTNMHISRSLPRGQKFLLENVYFNFESTDWFLFDFQCANYCYFSYPVRSGERIQKINLLIPDSAEFFGKLSRLPKEFEPGLKNIWPLSKKVTTTTLCRIDLEGILYRPVS